MNITGCYACAYGLRSHQHTCPPVYATDRDESDSCQAGTPGCAVDHTADNGRHGCETW